MSKHKSLGERPLINQKIREVRKAQKLTQPQVAQRMGMLYDTYSKKERCGKITIDWLLEFSDAVGVDPSVFADVLSTIVSDPTHKTFGFEQPSEVIKNLYGDGAQNQPKAENQKPSGMQLSATEEGIINTYRGLSKAKQKEVRDFINSKI